MRLRTRIILASLLVIAIADLGYSLYFIDRERDTSNQRLQATIQETNRLMGSVIVGPLYDGNVDQLNNILDSFFLDSDIVHMVLEEYRGDINLTRERQPPGTLGEFIPDRVEINRGLDILGEIRITYTTANIEQRLLQSRNEFLLLAGISLLGLAVVIYFTARGLTKPVDRLTSAARAMADGRLDQPIEAGGPEEIRILGQGFERMRDAIEEKIEDLAEKNLLLEREIVQRREAERERDRLVSVLEATTDMVGMSDPQGRAFYLNRAGRSLTGLGDGDISEIDVPQFHPDWATEIVLKQGIPTAVREGSWSGDTAVIATDGTEIPVSQLIISHHDADGKLQYLSTIMRDISERKRTELALRMKDDAIAASINGIVFADLAGRLTYANRAFLRMWGYDREAQVLGLDGIELWQDREAARRLLAQLETEDEWSGELTARRRDGSLFEALLSAAVIRDKDGRAVHLLGSFLDVTERKRAEEALRESNERLRQAVRVSQIGIFDHVHSQENIYWSPEQRTIFGFGPDEPVTLEGFIACVYPEDHDRIAHAVKLAHDPAGDGRYDVEHRIVRRDGQVRWLTTRSQTFFADLGEGVRPVRTIGADIDVTERKQTEQALRRLTNELEARVHARTSDLAAANKELEAFAYSVSHDLRAPLRAIDGFSRVLVEDYAESLDDEAQGYLARVRRAVQRMGDLIDDLLKLSRVSRAEMHPAAVDLTELTEEIVSDLRTASPTRQVEVSIAPGISAHGDPQLLRVALTNLIDNAWKYTGKTEQAHIEVGERTEDKETVYYVRDNGAGFDMQYVGKLFGAFQRLHSEQEFPGTGVGLATVARIIHRHGGRVWADSEPQKGATFSFTLEKTPQ